MTTLGISLIAGLALLGLRAAAMSLRNDRGIHGLLTALCLPIALVAGGLIALSVGVTPSLAMLQLAPVAAGLLVAVLTRQPGYGLLAGLVIAAAGSSA